MLDNPDIYLNTCRDCMGSGEVGLGFYQPCPVCNGTGSATPPDDKYLKKYYEDSERSAP